MGLMTEAEWLAADNPIKMFDFLHGRASDRKWRLFACGCCRHVWDRLLTDGSREAVEVNERLADGLADPYELTRIGPWGKQQVEDLYPPRPLRGPRDRVTDLLTGFRTFSGVEGMAREVAWETSGLGVKKKERRFQAALLRCVFGNPEHPPRDIDPSWLVRNDGAAARLAETVYEERALDLLPILADALEDAGCADLDLLSHLRSPGPHSRGCWVIDALLGKS